MIQAFSNEPVNVSGSSSVGRAPAFQAGCREFEPRLPLQLQAYWPDA